MTKLLSFTEDGQQWAWDSTSLGTFIACPRKYQYSMLEGWTAELRSVHLEFGGHYAKALERFHKLRAKGYTYDEAVRDVLLDLLIDTWEHDRDSDGKPIEGTGAPVDWLHNTKTRDTLVRSVVWYLDHFKDDPMTTVLLSNGEAAVEYSFSFDLTDGFVYCGHIDRLVHYGEDNDIYVQDQKTSGSVVTARYFEGYTPDIQMTGYTLAGSIIFPSAVKGVVIDAAQIAVGFTRFERGMVLRHQTQLEEFREEALHYIREAEACHSSGYYPMRRTSCGNYGGCEFRKVCSMQPRLRRQMLEGNFKKRVRWDPLARR
jgi:hypothetical protein